jgi:anthranilate phosphoribosyltransferase
MTFLQKLTQHQNLTQKEAAILMRQIMSGKMSDVIKSSVLTALAMKSETVDEIIGMARVMRKFSVKVPAKNPLLDTCGTGGSGLPRLNVSTAAAFILAACSVRVAKHGNRASGHRCGSFDLLESLGARIELGPKQVAKTIKSTNLGFIFAPLYHPAMKYAVPVRKKLSIRTVFNILGPLTNPANAKYQILGISDPKLGPMMIEVLSRLGSKRAMVVCGEDGLDEITLTESTRVWELMPSGRVKKYIIKPENFGLKSVSFSKIKGNDRKYNTKVIYDVLTGKLRGARLNLILLNAAAGLYVFGKAKSIKQGLAIAQKAVESGKVKVKLEEYIKLTKKM